MVDHYEISLFVERFRLYVVFHASEGVRGEVGGEGVVNDGREFGIGGTNALFC